MDIEQLRKKAAEMRASLFEKGVLNNYFLNLEYIEDSRPNFVEDMIVKFFSQSAFFLNELRQALETRPLNMKTVECLIMRLKGGSAMMGVARMYAIVSEMCNLLKRGATDRLYDEFQRVSAEHAILKSQLQPYAQILRMLREAGPPPAPSPKPAATDEGYASNGDVESTASNDMEE